MRLPRPLLAFPHLCGICCSCPPHLATIWCVCPVLSLLSANGGGICRFRSDHPVTTLRVLTHPFCTFIPRLWYHSLLLLAPCYLMVRLSCSYSAILHHQWHSSHPPVHPVTLWCVCLILFLLSTNGYGNYNSHPLNLVTIWCVYPVPFLLFAEGCDIYRPLFVSGH